MRERHSSEGNGALLAVVDSNGSYWDRCIVDETVLVALEHFGMPYRLLDLAEKKLGPETLGNCAGIILAQNRLGESITESETRCIAEAVKNGTGLVNFDHDLRLYKAPLLEIFGFDRINPHPCATNVLRIRRNDHYITHLQTSGEYHDFDKMVTAIIVEGYRSDVVALAEGVLGKEQLVHIRHIAPWSAFEPRNHPFLFATRWGAGKAVQFTVSPRIWRTHFFGHARRIDDLFWRSILWTARKPFASNMVPPFVVMSIDDCSGRHDFAYADIAGEHGYFPVPSVFLKDVPERLFPKIRDGLDSGKIDYRSHALSYYEKLDCHFGRGECSTDELKERFAFDDAWWRRIGAVPGIVNRLHLGEIGRRVLPFLKERGRVFFCPACQLGVPKTDQCLSDGHWPYELRNCYYDYLPDDHDFFIFSCMYPRGQEDFLSGCTTNLRESEHNDVEKAAYGAAGRIHHGLRGGFFADLVTHEQKFEALSLEEWERILARTEQLTGRYEKIHAHLDDIGSYLKGKDGVWISESTVEEGRIRLKLKGTTQVPLKISVFRDEGDSVVREWTAVSAFDEQVAVQ